VVDDERIERAGAGDVEVAAEDRQRHGVGAGGA
jgi:hypothetical protein